jgi:hypothetical protein
MKKILKWVAIVIAVLIVIALALILFGTPQTLSNRKSNQSHRCPGTKSHGGESQAFHSFRQFGCE